MMLSIELSNLIFFAHHGIFHEEKKIGGIFEVGVSVAYIPAKVPATDIQDTIDYTAVYQLVQYIMEQPEPLLETVCTKIADEIFRKFSQAEEAAISIKKLNPPIIAFEGKVGVKFALSRNNFKNIQSDFFHND